MKIINQKSIPLLRQCGALYADNPSSLQVVGLGEGFGRGEMEGVGKGAGIGTGVMRPGCGVLAIHGVGGGLYLDMHDTYAQMRQSVKRGVSYLMQLLM